MTIVTKQEGNDDTYDFFDIVSAEQEDGTTVQIKQLSGSYTLEELNMQLTNVNLELEIFNSEKTIIQEKIDLINNLS